MRPQSLSLADVVEQEASLVDVLCIRAPSHCRVRSIMTEINIYYEFQVLAKYDSKVKGLRRGA